MVEKLKSESVVVSSPLSFNGSALRIWKITDGKESIVKFIFSIIALFIISFVWMFVACWYIALGIISAFFWFIPILIVPFRMIRRSGRRQKRDKLRHQELIDAIKSSKPAEKE